MHPQAAPRPNFDGETYSRRLDHKRLTSQLDRVAHALKSGEWRTLDYLVACAGGNTASISARIRDLRKTKFGAHTIERRRTLIPGAFEYRMVLP